MSRQQRRLNAMVLLVVAAFATGCRSAADLPIQPGRYDATNPDGMDRVGEVLSSADVKIGICPDTFDWYDADSESRKKIERVEDLAPLLEAQPQKRLLVIQHDLRGNDRWEEYEATICRYARNSGFEIAIVTRASSAISVEDVIDLQRMRWLW